MSRRRQLSWLPALFVLAIVLGHPVAPSDAGHAAASVGDRSTISSRERGPAEAAATTADRDDIERAAKRSDDRGPLTVTGARCARVGRSEVTSSVLPGRSPSEGSGQRRCGIRLRAPPAAPLG